MKGFFTIAILWFVYLPLSAQWNDDFTDGDFVINPAWTGVATDFIIETGVLKLNAPAVAGESYLSTLSDISLEAEWNFWIKLDFNPSSSNFMKIYLLSDNADLTNVQNGYFVKIGGTPDEISLYKVSSGVESLIINGVDARVNLALVELNIQVTRDVSGTWELKNKLAGEVVYFSEGTINDLEIKKSSYFGVYCNYTSTRSTKMYVDDVVVTGNPYVDPDPPVLLSYSTPAPNLIKLIFNEELDTSTASNTVNYVLNNSETSLSATIIGVDTVLLEFSSQLSLNNTLEILNVSDLVGNTLDTIINVLFIDPAPTTYLEVVINELLADPSPQEDLPAFEFVEILNRSSKIIDLNGWQFTDGTSIVTLPSHLLYPDSLLILCPIEAGIAYQLLGTTIGLSSWPTLNNSGDAIKLLDDSGTIIDSLSYSIDWYKDALKASGGWSLEQINPSAKCKGIYNWIASTDFKGGTPGQINSVFNEGQDLIAPIITQALLQDSLVKVWFSEPVLPNKYQATILPNQISTLIDIITPTIYTSFILPQNLLETNNYTIEMHLEDCAGNNGSTQLALISIAAPSKGSVLINEIFPDPSPAENLPEHEFIEIVNISDHIFDLAGWQLTVGSKITTLSHQLLYPDSMLILCSIEASSAYQFFGTVMGLSSWSTLNNGGDFLQLNDANGLVIDSLTYGLDWYKDGTKDDGGWSLELINPNSKCTGKYNWTASTDVIGGTPGSKNSVIPIAQDLEPPIIIQAFAQDSMVQLWLSEPVLPKTYQGSILPDQIGVDFELFNPSNFLTTYNPSSLNIANSYQIEIWLEDCVGNTKRSNVNLIPIAQPQFGDIVINELLFDPYTGGSDFVEVLNSTSYYFNLQDYRLENSETNTSINEAVLLLKPHAYLAMSEDIVYLKNQYLAPDSTLFATNLPSMPNTEGLVLLRDNNGNVIDSVYYSEDYHFSLITDTEGVSLERISFEGNSNQPDNWKSAAETVKFATPGYKNSQSVSTTFKSSIEVTPPILTPNNDGQDDFCQIVFKLEMPTQAISIKVYNLNGQLVKIVANNALISPEGFFIWDGTDQQGNIMPTAHYIIISELISSKGSIERFTNKVVVANGF